MLRGMTILIIDRSFFRGLKDIVRDSDRLRPAQTDNPDPAFPQRGRDRDDRILVKFSQFIHRSS
jgi:hypothetical protein